MRAVEPVVISAVDWLRLLIEATSALIIATGFVVAIARFIQHRASPDHSFVSVRLAMGRFLALALEFQLAADILSTAIAPSWDQIGKLAAVAAIRSALNFLLSKEIEREEERTQAANSR